MLSNTHVHGFLGMMQAANTKKKELYEPLHARQSTKPDQEWTPSRALAT